MTIRARMYQNADDLTAMQQLTAQVTHDYGDLGMLHVGDIPHRIFNGGRGRPAENCVRLWHDDSGELVAWVAVYGRFTGFDWLVRPDLRGSEMENDLIRWAIEHTRREVAVAKDPKDYGADVFEGDTHNAALLEAHGLIYSAASPLYLTTRPLIDIPEPTLPDGFAVRTATGVEEAGKLAAVHHGGFGSGWTAETYRKVMESPGYDPQREWIVEAPDGRFAAFCVTWIDTLNKTMLFEPVGAHGDFRRMGLTRALMLSVMRHNATHGVETAIVCHESEAENPASGRLYRSLGFQQKYVINSYRLPKP